MGWQHKRELAAQALCCVVSAPAGCSAAVPVVRFQGSRLKVWCGRRSQAASLTRAGVSPCSLIADGYAANLNDGRGITFGRWAGVVFPEAACCGALEGMDGALTAQGLHVCCQ